MPNLQFCRTQNLPAMIVTEQILLSAAGATGSLARSAARPCGPFAASLARTGHGEQRGLPADAPTGACGALDFDAGRTHELLEIGITLLTVIFINRHRITM